MSESLKDSHSELSNHGPEQLEQSNSKQIQSQPKSNDQVDLDQLIVKLRSLYRSHHLEWIEHCEAMDRLRLRLSRKKRATLTPVSATIDISAGFPVPEPAGSLNALSGSNGIASLTAGGRTTRRTANFSTFGIGDAVTDAQFDLVLAQLGTADQKDPNIRALKTTADVPDMALFPQDNQINSSDHESDTLVTDPISFYELYQPETQSSNLSGHDSSNQQILNPTTLWSPSEQEAFEKAYSAQPKQFGWIASQVGTKTRGDCVLHYYRTKLRLKYRNLHSPPQTVAEGKTRELRGRRSRKGPFNKTQPDGSLDTLKPSSKPTQDPTSTADEPDDDYTQPTPNQPSIHSSALASENVLTQTSSLSEECKAPTLNAEPVPMSIDPSSSNQPVESDSPNLTNTFSPTCADLPAQPPPDATDDDQTTPPLGLSRTASSKPFTPAEFNTPVSQSQPSASQSFTNLVPSHSSSSVFPSSKPDGEPSNPRTDSSSWTSHVHKKRKLYSIPAVSSVPSSQQAASIEAIVSSNSTNPTSPPKPNPSTLHTPELPESAASSTLGSLDNPAQPNQWINSPSLPIKQPPSGLVPHQSVSSDLHHSVQYPVDPSQSVIMPPVTSGTSEADQALKSDSFSKPPKPTPAPFTQSSMQIKNLLNDDPLEPSASLSNMDANTWFDNHSVEPSPTQENPPAVSLPDMSNRLPPLNTPTNMQPVSLPPLREYHYDSNAVVPRPLSQPLCQPSCPPLPRPLSRPLSRPSSQSAFSQPLSSRLPPMSTHRPGQKLSDKAAPMDYHSRHPDGPNMVDERFADPPSSPVSPSGAHRTSMNPPLGGHHEAHLPYDQPKPNSASARSSLPHRTKHERSFLAHDHPSMSNYYHSKPHITSQSHMQPQTHITSQAHAPSPVHKTHMISSQAPTQPQSLHAHPTSHVPHPHSTSQSHISYQPSQSAHPHGSSQFASHASQRHMITSQLPSPTSAQTSMPQFPPIHSSPLGTHLTRLPPVGNKNNRNSSESIQHPVNHYIWPSPMHMNQVRGSGWSHHPASIHHHHHLTRPPNPQDHHRTSSSSSSTVIPPLNLSHSSHQHQQHYRTPPSSRKQPDWDTHHEN